MHSNPPTVLVFSGLDPSGGAGIQADIETLASHGCHACPIVTTLTVQNTHEIVNLKNVDIDYILRQAECIFTDANIAAIKIGLLGNKDLILELAKFIRANPEIPVVLDPVLASGNGKVVADADIIESMVHHLLPVVHFITPNHLEAQTLATVLGYQINKDHSQTERYQQMANLLLQQGCEYALITGGHESSKDITNIFFQIGKPAEAFQWQRLIGEFHGTGCTLASSIAGLIAQGNSPLRAVHQAQEFTWSSLKQAYVVGQGQLIPNRFFWATQTQDAET